jgi:seryl-tRNA(Sec) selenium transferase
MSEELNGESASAGDVRGPGSGGLTRRDLFAMGNAIALPAMFGGFDARAAGAAPAGPLVAGPQIYQSIGVEPVINCRGTFTIIGGSVERTEVRAAMDAAARHFVQIDELADAVGRRLAELTGAEWGMVSAGCAAGLKHVTAACVTGGNPEKLIRIPDLSGLDKTEVVVPRSSRNAYDHALRNVGVRMITVESIEELERALSSRTALIYLLADSGPSSGPMALEAVARIAGPTNIPILVDAAAEVLTIPNVHLQRGATIVAYSGGKAICGPQCAGLLLGRKDILQSAWQASSPHHGPGRDNKVGREETLGMLAAVEAWVKRDHAGEWKSWLAWLNTIARRVTAIDGVRTALREPTDLSNKSPSLVIAWDADGLHVTGEEIADELATTKPRIAIGAGMGRSPDTASLGNTGVTITAWQMQPGDDKIVASRLHAALSQKRPPRSTELAAPAADVSGRWDVDVEFFSSRSQHTLQIEQDGNWIQGSHKGDFSVRELVGTIEGDKVTLRSVDRRPGDSITFIFAGTVSGGVISGPIHLGEYLTARFTARRHAYSTTRTRIRVPTGPPLAT